MSPNIFSVLELDIRELAAVDAVDDLSPQAAGLEHVRLVNTRHTRAGGRERDPRDSFDLRPRVYAGIRCAVVRARLLAEVDPARQLTHDEQIGPVDQLALERARVVQRRKRLDRAQVGEQAKTLAQAEQSLLGPRLGGIGGVPLRATYRGEEHGVGAPTCLERLVGKRGAVRVDRRAAEQVLLVFELDPGGAQQLYCRPDDLGADPVAGKEDRSRCHRGRTVPHRRRVTDRGPPPPAGSNIRPEAVLKVERTSRNWRELRRETAPSG
jgi:hypothetical protein